MRVGGQAEFFTKINDVDRLSSVVRWAQSEALPYLVIGGGSNILVSDAGVRGLVIQNRCRHVEVTRNSVSERQNPIGWDPQLNQSAVDEQGRKRSGGQNPDQAGPQSLAKSVDELRQNGKHLFGTVVAESGAAMAGVARTSVRHGLAGLEWAVSVPGTIGGAIVNNAGAHGGEIKDNLIETQIVDADGILRILTVQKLAYAYRTSTLKSKTKPLRAGFHSVILWGKFHLERDSRDEVKERADAYLGHRRSTQPVEPSLGSMFMNPPDDFAGRLIEASGLKGMQVGDIQVSDLHANFIVNPSGTASGKAADVVALIQLIQETVEAKFGVKLQSEVQLVGEWQ